MTPGDYRLLPEGSPTSDHVDDAVFTVVTADGEVYTSFRIVRVTHEAPDVTQHWSHLANVSRIADDAIGVARLRVVDRVIVDARVVVSKLEE